MDGMRDGVGIMRVDDIRQDYPGPGVPGKRNGQIQHLVREFRQVAGNQNFFKSFIDGSKWVYGCRVGLVLSSVVSFVFSISQSN